MKAYTLDFRGVGRGKENFTLHFEGESMHDLPARVIRDVRAKGRLASTDVEVAWDEGAGTGEVIVGGFRTVGTFSIKSVEKGA